MVETIVYLDILSLSFRTNQDNHGRRVRTQIRRYILQFIFLGGFGSVDLHRHD
jgi:hypothetical protein